MGKDSHKEPEKGGHSRSVTFLRLTGRHTRSLALRVLISEDVVKMVFTWDYQKVIQRRGFSPQVGENRVKSFITSEKRT